MTPAVQAQLDELRRELGEHRVELMYDFDVVVIVRVDAGPAFRILDPARELQRRKRPSLSLVSSRD